MKPVVIINPLTGQRSYTKHPERLIARNRARWEAEQLTINAQAVDENPCYWNGSDRDRYAMHLPGEVRS